MSFKSSEDSTRLRSKLSLSDKDKQRLPRTLFNSLLRTMSGLCFRTAICAHLSCQFLKVSSIILLRTRTVNSECGLHLCQVQISQLPFCRTVLRLLSNLQRDFRQTCLDLILVSTRLSSSHATSQLLTKL